MNFPNEGKKEPGDESIVNDEDDDHKQDCNFISELYQKFMFKSVQNKKVPPCGDVEDENFVNSEDTSDDKGIDDDEEVEDGYEDLEEVEEEENTYSKWSKQYNSKNEIGNENNSNKNKENNKFSKSFEVKLKKS